MAFSTPILPGNKPDEWAALAQSDHIMAQIAQGPTLKIL